MPGDNRGMSKTPSPPELVVITGPSGAGRRTAGHTLEDLGWLLVDNLPPSMLPELLRISQERNYNRVAVILDVRSRSEFQQLPNAFAELGRHGILPQVLFIEASDEAIVKRQESARRPLPLQGAGPLLEGIGKERTLLADLRANADLVIDTTELNVREFADRVVAAYSEPGETILRLTLLSFGFKHGLPVDADLVLDVRFLPNPHWVPALRAQSGLTSSVSDYVLGQPAAEPWLKQVLELIHLMIPGYMREGKRHATIAIGCTGGKHRSTAITVELAKRLENAGINVGTVHRDLGRE